METPHRRAPIYLGRRESRAKLRSAASDGNDMTPTSVTWVATNLMSARQVLLHDDSPNTASTDVYALEISGTFTVQPPYGAPVSGDNLHYILDASEFSVIGYGVNSTPVSLASLGTPETDSLTGITPISNSQWHYMYRRISGNKSNVAHIKIRSS